MPPTCTDAIFGIRKVTVRVFWPVAGLLITNILGVSIKELLTVFFPHLARVCVDRVFRSGASVRIKARTTTDEAECPGCRARAPRYAG
jgi:hypothetical protein